MLLDDVATYLQTQGLGTVKTTSAQTGTAWLIYKGGTVTGDRADAIFLSEYSDGGPIDQMGATTGVVVAEEVGLQIVARHAAYSTAKQKAEDIFGALHKLGNVTLGSTRYLLMMAKQTPFPIGRDQSNRWMIGFNMRVTKERG